MKFINNGKGMELASNIYIGGEPADGSWLDYINNGSEWLVDKQIELMLKPLGLLIQGLASSIWHWFIANLPDIMGYTTMVAAIFIVLSSMVGKGGFMKPLAWYSAALILSFVLLGTV